jgi:hypothetical protein
MLPHEPESVESMLARFPKALEPVYATEAIREGRMPRPGQVRAHVFDFEDGVRMIASMDLDEGINGPDPFLHLSFSRRDEAMTKDQLARRITDLIAIFASGYKLIDTARTVRTLHFCFVNLNQTSFAA